jgi:hypothetical protein
MRRSLGKSSARTAGCQTRRRKLEVPQEPSLAAGEDKGVRPVVCLASQMFGEKVPKKAWDDDPAPLVGLRFS